ncbi:UDP-glycosyltransferase 72E3 [Citrus sinensis]|uniref:hydroquinone glucosyltransferase-like n=1 Tax=Citrus sinensis TaxID=2711 RepID=UPI0021914A5B|nr:hydroquinone glucosyltransferase-like [Citrus sinensis]KAH9692850.1 UDP-glycosyltransferase 72E3 [Citrus sinensis]
MVETAAKSSRPHVAVLASPGLGHVVPLLEFAKRLVINHGVHVRFLVITTNEASAAQEKLLRSLPDGLDVVDLPPVDVSAVTRDDMPVITRLHAIVDESLKSSLKAVLIELCNPRALVIDLFCTQAFEICSQLSIPTYSFVTTSIHFFAFALYLPTLDREVQGEFVDLPEPIEIPGCPPVRPEDLLDQVRNRKIDEYNLFLLHISRLPLAAGIFLNRWENLELVPLRAIREHSFYLQIPTPPIYPIGPLIKQDETLSASDEECLAWLGKKPSDSVIFVAPGSGGTLTAEQVTEMAWGLEQSKQRFIWVVRMPSDASASATFFNVGSDVNDPQAYLPEGFLQRTHGMGMVVPSWAPQVEILRHSSTGGFLSHCGWNSSLESICHGVPMIAWPLYAEQKMNAAMLTEEIGVAVKPVIESGKKVIGRGEIERVVRLVMESEQGQVMRRRVKELKESASRALEDGVSSSDSLARFVKKWKD